MGIVKRRNKKVYKPKKENEIKLNSYLIKKDGEFNKLGKSIL
jgi:hypothetical protein|tara:strand:+ start:1329 stop:1454 length:126 start_codon:yes stop_codon:yes gene_type:complete